MTFVTLTIPYSCLVCRDENRCVIDLSVSVNVGEDVLVPFIIGSSQILTLLISVVNHGVDPSFMTMLRVPAVNNLVPMDLPPNCQYSSTVSLRY